MANPAAKAIDGLMGETKTKFETSHSANPSHTPEHAKDGNQTMQALAWISKNHVKVIEAQQPKLVDPEDAILKVTGTTVCGSDMHLLHGAIIELKQGDILGHEFMGIVDEIGPNVNNVKVGDRVVVSFQAACGKCYMCQKKMSSVCSQTNSSSLQNGMYGNRTAMMFGYSHFTGGQSGGQAEMVRVPWANVNLLKIPESVADEDALYLSDILSTSYNQVVDSGVKEGDIVAIWGLGAIGIMCAKWSILKGARRVICIDNVQWRLDYVKNKIPEVELLNFNEHKNVPARINELTAPGTSPDDPTKTRPAGVDVALECAAGEYAKGILHKIELATGLETDTSEIVNEMIQSVVPFGTCGITGVYAGYTNHFNIGALMEKGVRFIGNGQAPVHKYWNEILNDYLVPGKIKPSEIFVSHRCPIEDTDKIYTAMEQKTEGMVKSFITTKYSGAKRAGPELSRMS